MVNKIQKNRHFEKGFMMQGLAVVLVVSSILIASQLDVGQLDALKNDIKSTEATIDHINEASSSYFIKNYPYATPSTFPAITLTLLKTTTIPASTATYINAAYSATTPEGKPFTLTTDAAGIHLTTKIPTEYSKRIIADKNGVLVSTAAGFDTVQFDKTWPSSPRDNHLYKLDGSQALTANFAGGGFSLLNVNNVTAAGTVSGTTLTSGTGGVRYTGDAAIVAGGACSPNGLTKTNIAGELFACKSGTWKSAVASSAGGVDPISGVAWDGHQISVYENFRPGSSVPSTPGCSSNFSTLALAKSVGGVVQTRVRINPAGYGIYTYSIWTAGLGPIVVTTGWCKITVSWLSPFNSSIGRLQ